MLPGYRLITTLTWLWFAPASECCRFTKEDQTVFIIASKQWRAVSLSPHKRGDPAACPREGKHNKEIQRLIFKSSS